MHEPIKVKDLIEMLQREFVNQDSYVHIPLANLSDVNDEKIRYEKFGSDIGFAVRDNGIYLLASHV